MTNNQFSDLLNEINTFDLGSNEWGVIAGLEETPLSWYYSDAPAIQVTGMFIALYGDSAEVKYITRVHKYDLELTFEDIPVYIYFAPWSHVEQC